MQRLEVSCAVQPIYGSLGVKRLKTFYCMKEEEMSRECVTYGKKINMCWGLVKKLEGKSNFSMKALIT